MVEPGTTSDDALAEARLRAMEEASAEARRLAARWRHEADGTHSSHHSDLRRTWADVAGRVADAIDALARRDEADAPQAPTTPQHRRPHHL